MQNRKHYINFVKPRENQMLRQAGKQNTRENHGRDLHHHNKTKNNRAKNWDFNLVSEAFVRRVLV